MYQLQRWAILNHPKYKTCDSICLMHVTLDCIIQTQNSTKLLLSVCADKLAVSCPTLDAILCRVKAKDDTRHHFRIKCDPMQLLSGIASVRGI